jgi:cell division protein FtsI (penicillin-binding protein 3)
MESSRDTLGVRRGYVHLLFLIAFVALGVRLAVIQVWDHEWLLAKARDMENATVALPAQRGMVLDREGRVLAVTMAAPSVTVNPRAVAAEERGAVAARLARILKIDEAELREKLAQPRYFAWVERKVTEAEADAVRQARLPGVTITTETVRRYPYGRSLCHVLGYVGLDGHGLEGVEAEFDKVLAGTPGEEFVHKDGLGRTMGGPDVWVKPPANGRSVMLTIDMRIQQVAEEELAAACEKHKPEAAAAVVLDPWTGDVLAMACWPPFDPENYKATPEARRRNLAVVVCLEPGSTFKPFVAAGALEQGVVRAETKFDCHQGVYVIGGRTLHDAHGYGILTVRDIIAYSSNIGMAQIGARMGPDMIYAYLRAYGFGQKTGIELPGESAGMLHHPRNWGKLTISSVPMGQEVAVSPLQLTSGFCVFANGGWRVKPRIFAGMKDAEGRRLLQGPPAPVFERALQESTAKLMCSDLLAGVVERGTAHSVAIDGYPMAGKTGTAQLSHEGARGYEAGAYAAAFVGIAPVESPRYVIGVVCKKPSGGSYYGGVVSAPAVAKIAERSLSMFRIPRVAAEEGDKSVAMKDGHAPSRRR